MVKVVSGGGAGLAPEDLQRSPCGLAACHYRPPQQNTCPHCQHWRSTDYDRIPPTPLQMTGAEPPASEKKT